MSDSENLIGICFVLGSVVGLPVLGDNLSSPFFCICKSIIYRYAKVNTHFEIFSNPLFRGIICRKKVIKIYVRKDHCKILYYLKNHYSVSRSEILRAFPHFDNVYDYIKFALDKTDNNEEIYKDKLDKYNLYLHVLKYPDYVNGEIEPPEPCYDNDNIYYSLNNSGYEYLEQKRRKAWMFWFPYIVTTIIAAMSVVLQIINLICEHCAKGTP